MELLTFLNSSYKASTSLTVTANMKENVRYTKFNYQYFAIQFQSRQSMIIVKYYKHDNYSYLSD